MDNQEQEHIGNRLGKWSVGGVPHRGWTCIDTEDLEEPMDTCEMCEFQSITYVHVMEHPHYPTRLRVRSICAGYMEGDYQAPRKREQSKRNESSRRANWLTFKG